MQEHRVPRDLRDVDWDIEALTGEDGVHDGYVLVCQVARHGKDQDAGCEGRRLSDSAGINVCVAGCGGKKGAGFVDVGQGKTEGAGYRGCGREVLGRCTGYEGIQGL